VLESEEIQLEKLGSKQPKVCSVWVHRTVFGGAPDNVRCARLALANWLLSGLRRRRTTINHWTVRWCTGLSGEPKVGRANGRPQNPRATRGKCQRSEGTPDSVRCANGSKAPTIGFAKEGKKSAPDSVRWCTGQCPVVHRTVRCARRQKARFAFLECSQRLLAALGL
jgi:hypothetical protein